jgi:hypothetical protein
VLGSDRARSGFVLVFVVLLGVYWFLTSCLNNHR